MPPLYRCIWGWGGGKRDGWMGEGRSEAVREGERLRDEGGRERWMDEGGKEGTGQGRGREGGGRERGETIIYSDAGGLGGGWGFAPRSTPHPLRIHSLFHISNLELAAS